MIVVKVQSGLEALSVGAKAANLGKAMESGFLVPEGFVITRQALQLFLEETALLAPVQGVLARAEDLTQAERTAAYQGLCEKILAAPIPQSLTDGVVPLADAFFAKAPQGLAVRSSGIYEDSARASFAGVYESFLGINSVEELWKSIRQCWCAAWAPTALDYGRKMGIEPVPDAMAVLVQPLLAAASAGVLFSADPQTGNPWRFVLESTFGLAQELVGTGGSFAADRFVFAWDSGRIVKKEIAQKTTAWVAGAAGVEQVGLEAPRQAAPSLADEMATAIARLALEVDRAFGCRVDIEWVVVGGEVYLVQVRPITALPEFFPHYLPQPVRDQTWKLAALWHFPYKQIEGKLMPPLYRDLSIVEKHNRYLQIGPVEMPPQRLVGAEMDFNGHRYQIEDSYWPEVSAEQREAYLEKYEAKLRHDYLDAIQQRYPAMAEKAIVLAEEAQSLAAQIDALLWARDATFDMYSITAGPSQSYFAFCNGLLRDFVAQYLPECQADDLVQGHHPVLDPYYPEVQVVEAEKMAQAVGSDRQVFEQKEGRDLFAYLFKERADSPFMQAFEEYCHRFGLLPPSRFDQGDDEGWGRHFGVLKLVRGVLKGKGRQAQAVAVQANARRQACVEEARHLLAERNPDQVPRFERLLDWAFFWGPALNNRGWIGIAGNRLGGLVRTMCQGLKEAGLVEASQDVGYFSAADLAHIAATQDLEEGRRIWRQRRFEYERDDRLAPPAYLGKAPAAAESEETPNKGAPPPEETAGAAKHIQGKRAVPGKGRGIALRIESFDAADTVGSEHVLVFTEPLQLSSQHTPMLLSLMLRIRGLVCQGGPMMWMHHIGQIARECGVPVVQIGAADMELIPAGAEVEIDGGQGTVSIL